MSRKPTAQSIRVGQTLYYVTHALASPGRRYTVGSVQVKSDALPIPPDGVAGPYPRRFIAEHLRKFPGDMTYSRRNAERQAREGNDALDRVNRQIREKARDLVGLVERREQVLAALKEAAQ